MQKTKLPLLSNRVFVEQINVKVDQDTKRRALHLKGHGIDTAELFREKLKEVINDAFKTLDAQAS
jgi:hypothetical protein